MNKAQLDRVESDPRSRADRNRIAFNCLYAIIMSHHIIRNFVEVVVLLLLFHRVQSNNDISRLNSSDSSGNVLQMDLHPVSVHIRRIELELEVIDHELNSGSHHLRHLQEKTNKKKSLQYELQQVQEAMKGKSAAYASLMEFPCDTDHPSRYLREYHDHIQEFNEKYRQYSRYERALREAKQRITEPDETYFLFSKENDISLKGRMGTSTSHKARQIDNPSVLFETNWQVVQIEYTNATETPQFRITISMDGDMITGETGCNFYRARIIFHQNQVFQIGSLATTRMACEPERMEQEGKFVKLMEYTEFSWEIVDGELILSLPDRDNVARFVEIPFVRDIDESVTTSTISSNTAVETDTTTLSSTKMNADDKLLFGTKWQAIQIGYGNSSHIELKTTLPDHAVTLSFDMEGRIGGSLGCNSYGGDLVNVTGSTFNVGPLMTTMMYCFDEGVMEQERAYSQLFLDGSFFYEITEGDKTILVLKQLVLDDESGVPGNVVATFELLSGNKHRRKIQVSVQEANNAKDNTVIGTEWRAKEFAFVNNTSASPSGEMHHISQNHTITIGFESATKVYGNTGCNNYFSLQAMLMANRIDIGGIATTRMICSEDGVMEQENEYISFLSERSFFYRVLIGNDEEDELIFAEVISDENGYEVEGQVLARFVRLHALSAEHSQMLEQFERELNEVAIKKKGGKFNSYQTTPVHQGYGTHFATMWVGTPPQRKSVIIDTGSHYTAFPCKGCLNCGEEHHTDPLFDPDESSTFHALTCSECQSASCLKGKCVFSQTCE